MSQLSEAVEIIRQVLQLNVANGIGVVGGIEVKVSSADSKEIQAKIIDKFGCSKQTAYYYYFYRGKKFLTDEHKIVFVHDKAAPKRKKSADQIVKDQIANLEKQGPASPFRL
tara:strand:+ start:77 stop:412 length:336 start_codon:yes stop_codon:yes gene_type:complete